MRIVHVIDYFQPKLGYQETFLAKEHGRLGHDVYVVTSDRYNPIVYSGNAAEAVLGKRVKEPGFFIEEDIKVWRLKTLFEIPNAIWMLGLEGKLKELKPDIVIVHGIVNFVAIRIARLKKKLGNFKLIYDDHMVFAASRSKLRILYPLFKWTFSRLIQETADALVGVARTSKTFMNKKYGIPLESIRVIPLGADDNLFLFDATARQQIRSQLSISEGETVFIYAGKIIREKAPHIFVVAATDLMKKNDNIRVVLVGNGSQSYVGEMKQHIKSENLEGRFIWHDAVPNTELHKFYSAADVAVWPKEASLSMMEAMACGLPVIISDDSEVFERLEYNNGLTYQNEDSSDLAKQMKKLLNPKLREEMGRNGRKLVEEKLNWRVIAKQFIELCFAAKQKQGGI